MTTVLEKLAIEQMMPPGGPVAALPGPTLLAVLLTPGAWWRRSRQEGEAPGWKGVARPPRALLLAVLLANVAPEPTRRDASLHRARSGQVSHHLPVSDLRFRALCPLCEFGDVQSEAAVRGAGKTILCTGCIGVSPWARSSAEKMKKVRRPLRWGDMVAA